jgi:restriction endonuclease S subunit
MKAQIAMIKMTKIVELNSGTPQFRIKEDLGGGAPTYYFYGQPEIEEGLIGLDITKANKKQIKTFDKVSTVASGDVIFSLISGKAAIVQSNHNGYLFTQNYVRLAPTPQIDAEYLVYMLNEDADINRQLQSTSQGSVTLKFTIRQLSDLLFPIPPPIEKQRVMGELYFNQRRLAALKKRVTALETTLIIEKLKEANRP